MALLGGDVARRLVEARARRAIWENRADADPHASLELGRAFLPGLSRNDAKARAELAAMAEPDESSTPDAIRGLSTVQVRVLGEIAFQALENPSAAVRALAVELFRDLAQGRAEPLGSRIQRSLREKEIFHPALLYRDAGVAETRALLALLDREPDPSRRHDLLTCLAWTRSDLATETFRDWLRNPPAWASSLKIPLADYPPLAGWRAELT